MVIDHSDPTSWIDSSPMAAYGRVPLDEYVQTSNKYDAWTADRDA